MPEMGDAEPQALHPAAAALQAKFEQGMALHQQGKLADAERIYQEVLQQQPYHFDAMHLLGVVALQTRRSQRSAELIAKAIELNQNVAAAHSNLGSALIALQRFEQALASFDKAISLKPDYAEAHHDRAATLNRLERHEEALASYDKAIALKPDDAEWHYNRGNTLNLLKRQEQALASYDKAIALKPDYAEVHSRRGLVLLKLKRPTEALESFDRAIALKPDYFAVHVNRGNALGALRRYEEALASCDRAIALKPDSAEAHNNRGHFLNALNRHREALASFDRAIALRPDFVESYVNRGDALRSLKRADEAILSFNKAIALKPDYEFLYGDLLYTKMIICDWGNLEAQFDQLVCRIGQGEKVSKPFPLFAMTNSPELQRRAAEIYALANYPQNNALPMIAKRPRREKIRIGYFSADFRNHPGTYSMVEMFERHDRSRFEIIGFSFSPRGHYELKSRLESAFDKFVDINDIHDLDAARLARQMEIDIAIDRNGFTTHCRPNIFASRAAPLQVSYKGYPGTMGVDYVDYLIADANVVPAGQRRHYAEKIAYMPNSYQVYDSKRGIPDRPFSREQVGLPQEGFVFCCFNANYKILPAVFDRWMRILKMVEGSVLWLLEDNARAAANLRREAGARGVSPDRLVFAKRMPLSDHLARHRLADLFLDTLPYNAHTTANDALWAGLPVLTQIGDTFAGRVAASLLTAIGLPELITSTPQAYESLAIDLAGNREKMAAIKQKLANNRLTTPLFDTQLFTRHIEAAYTAMYERHQTGLPPDHIIVPN